MRLPPIELFRSWLLFLFVAGAALGFFAYRFETAGDDPDSEFRQTFKYTTIVALLFAVSLIAAAAIVIRGMQGHYVWRVTYNTMLIAIGSFTVLGVAVLGRVIRIGLAFWGTGAAMRLLTFCLLASPEVQRLSAVGYNMMTLIGSVTIAVGGIQWFREAHHRKRSLSAGSE
jgi:high-affinity K+ transport system ATPase subunit B